MCGLGLDLTSPSASRLRCQGPLCGRAGDLSERSRSSVLGIRQRQAKTNTRAVKDSTAAEVCFRSRSSSQTWTIHQRSLLDRILLQNYCSHQSHCYLLVYFLNNCHVFCYISQNGRC